MLAKYTQIMLSLKPFLALVPLLAMAGALGCSRMEPNSGSDAQQGGTRAVRNKGQEGSGELILKSSDDSSFSDGIKKIPEGIRLLNATGLIFAPGKLETACTLTHLGNNLGLTAGHCVPSEGSGCGDLTINWSSGGSSVCEKILFNGDRTHAQGFVNDVAVIRIGGSPKQGSVDVANLKTIPPATDMVLWILGYASGKIALSRFDEDDCVAFSAGNGSLFPHRCDTTSNFSGALIFKFQTGEFVGMHAGDLGNESANQAIPASVVKAAINNAR